MWLLSMFVLLNDNRYRYLNRYAMSQERRFVSNLLLRVEFMRFVYHYQSLEFDTLKGMIEKQNTHMFHLYSSTAYYDSRYR